METYKGQKIPLANEGTVLGSSHDAAELLNVSVFDTLTDCKIDPTGNLALGRVPTETAFAFIPDVVDVVIIVPVSAGSV